MTAATVLMSGNSGSSSSSGGGGSGSVGSGSTVQMISKEALDDLYADLSRNITDSDRLLLTLLSTRGAATLSEQQQEELLVIAVSELRSKLTAVAGCANSMFAGIVQALSHALRLQREIADRNDSYSSSEHVSSAAYVVSHLYS